MSTEEGKENVVTKSTREIKQTTTDSSADNEGYNRGDVAATEQKRILKEAKE
jgi:hypothetical protein